jgi:polar amino acid transport system substrate-binding protein
VRSRPLAVFVIAFGFACAARAVEEDGTVVLAATETAFRQYEENGKAAGYISDILMEAFRRAGHPVKLRFMPWGRCLSDARTGAIDGIFGATRTPERETEFLFADEILIQETQSAFVRVSDETAYEPTIAGLADVRIGLMNATSTGIEFDKAVSDKRLRHVDIANSFDSLIQMLTGKRVEVIVAERLSVLGVAKKHGLQNEIRELPTPVLKGPVYVAFTRARDMSAVAQDFSAALHGMKQDGSYGDAFSKYYK